LGFGFRKTEFEYWIDRLTPPDESTSTVTGTGLDELVTVTGRGTRKYLMSISRRKWK
jgi:hypothetical protein